MWNGCSFSTQKCFKTFVFVFFFIIHCELYYTNEGFQEVVDNGSKVVGDVKYLVLFVVFLIMALKISCWALEDFYIQVCDDIL